MENTFVVNEEPITIKITIEVIPSKKKEDVKEVPVVANPSIVVARQTNSPEGWDAIEPENPTVVPPIEPVVIPVATPEKKKRAYTRKTKTTEEVVKEEPVEEKKPTKESPVVEEVKKVEPVNKSVTSTNPNKVVARLAQMIRFYCKASGISTTEVTKKYLIEHGAADIIEGATDEDIEEAFKEVIKK